MPAIEPARLSREVQAVTLAFDRPAELVDRVLALFDFYADRVLRPGAYASMRAPQRSFSAPLPVINSLRQALGREAAARPELAWDIADALWSVGYHESYLLAAAVLEPQTGARVAAWVEERLRGGLEVRLSRLLATSAWRGWRAADPQGFLTLVEAWVQGKDAARQGFAYLALQAAAAEAPTNRLAPLIDLLYRLPSPRTAAVQQSRRDLLRGLAERSPSEVAAYLLHEHARAAPGSDRDLRLLLGLFPPELRERLRLALRG